MIRREYQPTIQGKIAKIPDELPNSKSDIYKPSHLDITSISRRKALTWILETIVAADVLISCGSTPEQIPTPTQNPDLPDQPLASTQLDKIAMTFALHPNSDHDTYDSQKMKDFSHDEIRRIKSSTFHLQAFGITAGEQGQGGGKEGMNPGTGWVAKLEKKGNVSYIYFVTARHVPGFFQLLDKLVFFRPYTDTSENPYISTGENGLVTIPSQHSDLAVIKAPISLPENIPPIGTLPFISSLSSAQRIAVETPVATVGYPINFNKTRVNLETTYVNEGYIGDPREASSPPGQFYFIEDPNNNGGSGSPIVTRYNGQLQVLGVVTGGREPVRLRTPSGHFQKQPITYGIYLSEVNSLLEQAAAL